MRAVSCCIQTRAANSTCWNSNSTSRGGGAWTSSNSRQEKRQRCMRASKRQNREVQQRKRYIDGQNLLKSGLAPPYEDKIPSRSLKIIFSLGFEALCTMSCLVHVVSTCCETS